MTQSTRVSIVVKNVCSQAGFSKNFLKTMIRFFGVPDNITWCIMLSFSEKIQNETRKGIQQEEIQPGGNIFISVQMFQFLFSVILLNILFIYHYWRLTSLWCLHLKTEGCVGKYMQLLAVV